MIRACVVLAVDGTHNAGKSTLVAALVDHYRDTGLDVAHVDDQARDSPLIAQAVNDPETGFDLTTQIDLIAATVTSQIRASAGRQLLIVDKTVGNVLAYAHLFLADTDRDTLDAARGLCRAWQPYDLVIRCRDHYPIDLTADPYRAKVTDLQATAADRIETTLLDLGYPVVDLPTGLTPAQRLTWITVHPALTRRLPTLPPEDPPCSAVSSTST